MDRRQLLQQLGRQAAAVALSSLFGHAARAQAAAARWPPGLGNPFTLGVASGMPRPDSVAIWTRLAPRPLEPGGGLPATPLALRWELAEDERFSKGVRRGEFVARPEHGHSVHVDVGGLTSGRTWYYRFIAGDAASPIGRTRTAPAEDEAVGRLRIALASCQHYEQGWYVAHREIAAREVDLVLFVGDYIYESSSPRYRLRAHEGPAPHTLDAYRARHATYKLDADLRAAHAAHPWLLTWDDHEVENDYAGEVGPAGRDRDTFLQRRAAAYQAYFEHLPVSPSMAPRGAAMRIHQDFRWGRLAELWTLDNRQYRSLQACSTPYRRGGDLLAGCDELADPARTMLGREQEAWLARGLAGSQSRWQLLAQSTQLSPCGLDTPLGRRLFSDGWDGYPRARERLLDAIAAAGRRDVLVLGGDVHRHVSANLRLRPDDPRSPVVASEFVCSSITSRGLSEAVTSLIRASNPDLLHARSDERGYALLEITPEAALCDFRATPFPAQADARLHSQARFVVEAGQPGVVRD
ncbi:alkaline phosphatase D family protein [uncultured Piscinibacter sp.]|uniref:alkaline phosphatase D family protein n=1 Tax=uncultured Piscinibacter sp. TaxID=1131835 RepID=UPI002622C20B|nr:alkaline phosphatase D family protein [uncultured Piscinibacter sp.]